MIIVFMAYKYCIKFLRGPESFEIYLKDEDSKQLWMDELSKYCILSEFNYRYTVIEKIANGSMGQVKSE